MNLFLDQAHPLTFEKKASPIKLSDNADNWQKEIASEIFKQAPFLSEYAINIIIEKAQPERGYAFGSAEVTSRTDAPQAEQQALPRIIVPLIVKDRLLMPLDVFMDGKEVFPLSERRAREHLFRTDTMELSTRKPQDQGMVDQLYPPLRTNYGYGNAVSTGVGTGGLGKFAEALLASEVTPNKKPYQNLQKRLDQPASDILEDAAHTKLASLLEAVLPTVAPVEADQFISAISNDPALSMAAAKNPAFNKAAFAIAKAPTTSVEKTAAALVGMIRPTVVQLIKQASGNFKVKWANAGAFAPQEGMVGPDQAAAMAGSDRVVRMQPGEAITVSTDKAKKDTLENEKLEQVRDFGCYRVQNAETAAPLVGWVIPIMDFEMQPLPLYLFSDGMGYSVQDEIAGSRVSGSLEDFMQLFGGPEPPMPMSEETPPQEGGDPDMPAQLPGPPQGQMPKQASFPGTMARNPVAGHLVGGAIAGGGIGALIPSRDAEGNTHRLRNAAIGAAAGAGLNAAGGQAMGNFSPQAIQRNLNNLQHMGVKIAAGVQPAVPGVGPPGSPPSGLAAASPPQDPELDVQSPLPQEMMSPDEPDTAPHGDGAFVHLSNERALALPPVTIKATTTGEDGAVSYLAEDTWGEQVEIHVAPGSEVVMELGPGSYTIPESFKWMPLQQAIHLVKNPLEMAKVADARRFPHEVQIITTGVGEYHLKGRPLDLLDGGREFLKQAEAEFLLVGMGMSPFDARDKMAEARKMGMAKVAGLRQLVPLATLHCGMMKKAASALGDFPYHLRRDLIKEAAALEDGETVDNILAMNFINPENINTFSNYLPELDSTASKLAEMLMAARLGMNLIPEGAAERAMKATEEVIEGLRMLQQKAQG